MPSTSITSIRAREVIDSRGNPTISAQVCLEGGAVASAMVPSGASTGIHEAVELRDGDKNRYGGKGVLKAIANIHDSLAPAVIGKDAVDQDLVDQVLIETDGSKNKARYGANAILAISLAVARAASVAEAKPLYEHIHELYNLEAPLSLPIPMINVLNGGVHAHNNVDIQEFMLFPLGAPSFKEAVRYGAETFHVLQQILDERGLITAVGDEGGFAPNLKNNEEAIQLIVEAIERAGYRPGVDISLCIDAAASEFMRDTHYVFTKSNHVRKDREDLIAYYKTLISKYPIVSIEDGVAEQDWIGWANITEALGQKIQLVGDDLFATNPSIFSKGIERRIANAILVKPNQVGTLTETLETIRMARMAKYDAIIAHRSGETEDTFIADIAVGTGVGQIKTGSLSRSERVSKYNRLLAIEAELPAPLFGTSQFRFLAKGLSQPVEALGGVVTR
jgi:enolase